MVSGRRGWKVAAGAALAFGAIAGCGELAGLGDRPTLVEDEAGALRANAATSADSSTSADAGTDGGLEMPEVGGLDGGDASDERGDGPIATSGATELVYDGFEGDPASRWETLTSGDGGVAGFDLGVGTARTGQNDGWLQAENAWAAERLPVPLHDIPPRASCTAFLYVEPETDPGQVDLQIWDPNGWTMPQSSTTWVAAGVGYVRISTVFDPAQITGDTLYVQVIYGSPTASPTTFRIDDLDVWCVPLPD
jgi:hypothetical protein